jgi:glucose-1-phosphatase
MDPTFNPVITDDSAAFSEKAVQAMEKERQKMQLAESYKLLEAMTDYPNSPPAKRSSRAR